MPVPINSNIDYDKLINQLETVSSFTKNLGNYGLPINTIRTNKLKTNMQTVPMADPRDSFNYEEFEKEMLNNTNSFFNKRQPSYNKSIHKPTNPIDVLARKLERERKRAITREQYGVNVY